jgi:nicotinamide-nucleotide amidase
MDEDLRLEAQVGAALLERGWTIATAESCTGGLIAHRLTNIAGSSAYVIGGVITYANTAKMSLLKVREETLARVGAVSEQTAREMAQGALKLFGVDLALSVTGIAGPGGGTPEKPVGLAYIGAATRSGRVQVIRQVSPGDREAIKAASADTALRLALTMIAEG